MQAKVISLINQKGGCGKTMTAMQLAGTFGLHGIKTLIVDMDLQHTADMWHSVAAPETPFPASLVKLASLGDNFLKEIEPLLESYDLLILDCPPAILSDIPHRAALLSDLVILPVIPVLDNVWAARKAEEVVLNAQKLRSQSGDPNKLIAVYLRSAVARNSVHADGTQVLEKMARLPILKSFCSYLKAYPECQAYGCVVSQLGKGKATTEILNLTTEIAKLLGLKLKSSKR
jgi:chromosome partitioning protein